MLKISLSETPSEEKLTTKDKSLVFKRLTEFFFAAMVAVFAVYIGPQCVAGGVYLAKMFEQMTTKCKTSALNRLTGFFFAAVVAVLAVLIGGTSAKAQNVGLANESLARPKDRFTFGVTDSVEVVQAEQALASPNDQYITSPYE
ncbi:MAG TPA: hypothetical protein VFN26_18015 [Candidatus Acidoferrum sp.]|nr:hypothetical protein [Candidatus Acidoferrum sp.]